MAYQKPRWLRDLVRFLPLRSQFVLSGNVHDQYPVEIQPDVTVQLPLISALAFDLQKAGFSYFLTFDPAQGFSVPNVVGANIGKQKAFFAQNFELQIPETGRLNASMDHFFDVLELIVRSRTEPIALFCNFASRLLVRPDNLNPGEQRAFTRSLVLSYEVPPRPVGAEGKPFFNNIFWIVAKEGDLPDWLVVGNPRVRHIPIPNPDRVTRRTVAQTLSGSLEGAELLSEVDRDKHVTTFVEATEGLLTCEMAGIATLCRSEKLKLSDIGEAVRRYKLGVTEDPWKQIDKAKLDGAETFIRSRVKGQTHAVTHMLDLVKRAVSGLTARKGGGGRPRGIAFLAGPTGVGKTELAKTITHLLFGDEVACIRFDMSEFSAEHSDQRLIGAPPGYVGYDVGGELTNAVRQRPFSVVLFDEIEKAHPRILDKFLQVLDDGVLTSGRGERVYFSETFLLFTSNLGIYRLNSDGERVPNVSLSEPLAEIQLKVRTEIDRHFKLTLGRPEILNRIGENVIVFDFIRKPVADEIFESMLEEILAKVTETQGITIRLADGVYPKLLKICTSDLSNGGRGIRNQLETHFINPLARVLFNISGENGTSLELVDVIRGPVTELKWRLV